jgi:hypothetical protein
MLRRPIFWVIFAALSFAAAVFTLRNFSAAFPLVAIDLQMDRAQALRLARSLAEERKWPSAGFDQAAAFSADQEVQNFIELEGGGKPELGRILKDKVFAPYTWRVRFFKEGDAHETFVQFTPEGEPYGFRVKLPDGEKGESIPVEDARRVAEETARNDWKIDFSRYQLAETSRDVRQGGRTDHTFVYERQDQRVGEGRYRLRLVTGGASLTELTHFVQIPEAFSRRYEQMRSANDAINAGASIAVFGLYILGFCGVGLFFMIRQHRVVWRQAILWAILISLLMGLQQLNSWPLVWMNYDTAVPASGFAIRQVMTAVGVFAALSILLTVSFTAAETLSRRAFPHHIQMWKLWSRPVAASPPVLGQTLTGYLLVAPFFAYEIVLYFFAQGRLGWWTPSDTLVNPDMFANYLPSLSAISLAAQAGFWEECLFRAAPLAAAALIGDRFGRRRAFIVGAMILQALVFAAGHAGYANQPPYARVVELIIPSFAFGILYLAFGLLPGIVLHFAYDTVWMALPLFVSTSSRAYLEQAIVVLAVLIPVWVLIVNRMRAGASTQVPNDALNGAWKPPASETPRAGPQVALPAITIPNYAFRVVPALGLAALVVWLLASSFRADAPAVGIGRSEAVQQARQTLAQQGIQLDSSWTTLSYVLGQPGDINRFVWQTAGRDVYQKLLGTYVTPPSWIIRFARFKGDVAERAEQYQVYVDGSGRVFRVDHDLPEARAGKSLTEDEARTIATGTLRQAQAPSGTTQINEHEVFSEISAQASKRPARTDWTFVFKDTRDMGLPQGEPRVSVEINGDQVSDITRYVYIPEDWSRNERARRNLPNILGIVCTIVLISIVTAGAVLGAVYWSRRRPFSTRAFLSVFVAGFLLNTANILNSLPSLASQASTAQSLELQTGIVIATSILFAIFTAAGLGLAAGLAWGSGSSPASANDEVESHNRLPARKNLVLGVSLGLTIAAAAALARSVWPSLSPDWGTLSPASAFIPFVAAALSPVLLFLTQTIILLTVLYVFDRRRSGAAGWILTGILLTGSSFIDTIPSWLITGVVTGAALLMAYLLVFRHQRRALPIAVAAMVILSTILDGAQHMYPAALAGSLTGAVLVAASAWIWIRGTMKDTLAESHPAS